MATKTTNYNLTKPAYDEDADIKVINDNMDIIDAKMKEIEEAGSGGAVDAYTKKQTDNLLLNKVDKVDGKGLSTNDFEDGFKNKLNGIEEGANKTVVDSALSSSSTNPVQNKVVNTAIGNKVDKVSGKGLSTNDLTSTLKSNYDVAYTHSQSAHAPSNAQANVIETVKVNGTDLTPNSKAVNVIVPTKVSQLINDSGFKTTDNNTTYSLSKSGSTITLTGSDGSKTTVSDSNTTYSAATTSANGLMSSDDKTKLEGIETGANKTTIDSALSTTSTNPVQNKVVADKINEINSNLANNYGIEDIPLQRGGAIEDNLKRKRIRIYGATSGSLPSFATSGDNDMIVVNHWYATNGESFAVQIAYNIRGNNIAFRRYNNGWQNWVSLI